MSREESTLEPADPADLSVSALDRALEWAFPREASGTDSLGDSFGSAPSFGRHPTLRALEERGRYKIEGVLGRGGMGVVLKARDSMAARPVAIKILRELEGQRRVEASTLFLEEARTAARLEHPGILPLYDLGILDGLWPWYSMRLVDGETLAQRMERCLPGEDPIESLLTIFRRIAEAVAYAHACSVVHCDLKPSNILLGRHGEVFVTDWGLSGLARAGRDSAGTRRRRRSLAVGTPTCMAPEQARGELAQIGPATDTFALGALLAQILTRAPIYDGSSRDACVAMASAAELGPALARLEKAEVDADLKEIVRLCLAPEPKVRPQTAGEIVALVAQHRSRVRARLRQSERSWVEQDLALRHARRSRRLIAALAVTILVSVVGASLGFHSARSRRFEEERIRVQRAAVAEALVEKAVAHVASARSSHSNPEHGVERWSSAELELVRLSELNCGSELPPGLVDHIQRLTAEVRQGLDEAKAASRLASFVSRLAYLREQAASATNLVALDRDYQQHFADYGFAPERPSVVDSSTAIANSPLREAAILGLLDWMVVKTALKPRRTLGTVPLLDVAIGADADPVRRRVLYLLRDGDTENLLSELQLSASRVPASVVHLAAHLYHMDDEPKTALSIYRCGVIYHPTNYWLHYGLAFLAINENPPQYEEARRHFQVAVALQPESGRASISAGTAATRLGDLVDARRRLERGLAFDPDNYRGYDELGRVHQADRNWQAALEAFRRARSLEPATWTSWLGEIEVLLDQGRGSEARQVFSAAGVQRPAHPAFWLVAFRLHILHGEWKEAQGVLDRDLPRAAAGRAKLMELCAAGPRGLGDAGLLMALRALHRSDPADGRSALELGLALYKQGQIENAQLEEARRAFEAALSGPEPAKAHYHLGLVLRRATRFDEAVGHFERAASRHRAGSKERGDLVALVARTKQDQIQWDRLSRVLAGTAHPHTEEQWKELIAVAAGLRRYHEERRLWQLAFQVEPPLFLDSHGRDRAHAARTCLLERADLGSVESPEAWVLLGWALEYLEAALASFEASVESGELSRAAAQSLLKHWCSEPTIHQMNAAIQDPATPAATSVRYLALRARVSELARALASR